MVDNIDLYTEVELDCGLIEKINDNVIMTTYKTSVVVEVEDAMKVDEAYSDLSEGRRVFSIVNVAGIHSSMTNEAQAFLSKDAKMVPNIVAAGIVVTNLPIRILARFFISKHKPPYPTKIFASTNEALRWFDLLNQN